MSKELYNILDVPEYANIIDIQNIYLKLKKNYKQNKDSVNLTKLNEAYNIISNSQMRKLYDQGILDINLDLDLNSSPGNLFFENINLKHFLQHNDTIKKGENITLFVDISLAEAYAGCKKKFEYSLKMPCNFCATCCPTCLGKKHSSNVKSVVAGLTRVQKNKCIECNELGYIYNEYSTDKCTVCTGTGKKIDTVEEFIEIPQKKTICNICKGTKSYVKRFRDPIDEKKICNKCFGRGKKKSVICIDCNGNGYLIIRKGYHPIYKTHEVNCEDCDENGLVGETIKKFLQNKTVFNDCNKCNGKGFNIVYKEVCKNCDNKYYTEKNKYLFLNLYPGIENGKQFIIPKNGEQILDGDPGNLIITINVNNNSLFKRIESNLKLTLIIHFVKTIVGALYKINLPSNEIIVVDTKEFKEIINPLKLYIYKNKGMPIYDLEKNKILGYGDLYIQFNVIYGKISYNISEHYLHDLEILFSKIYHTLDDNNNDEMTVIDNNITLTT